MAEKWIARIFGGIGGLLIVLHAIGTVGPWQDLLHRRFLLPMGDQTATVGITLVLISAMWLFHVRSKEDIQTALRNAEALTATARVSVETAMLSVEVTKQSVQIQHEEVVLASLQRRVEDCAKVHGPGWMEMALATRGLVSWLHEAVRAETNQGRPWGDLSYEERRLGILREEFEKPEGGELRRFIQTYRLRWSNVQEVVVLLHSGLTTLDRFPASESAALAKEVYWGTIAASGLMSPEIEVLLQHFPKLIQDPHLATINVRKGLPEHMQYVLDQWMLREARQW